MRARARGTGKVVQRLIVFPSRGGRGGGLQHTLKGELSS